MSKMTTPLIIRQMKAIRRIAMINYDKDRDHFQRVIDAIDAQLLTLADLEEPMEAFDERSYLLLKRLGADSSASAVECHLSKSYTTIFGTGADIIDE